MGGKPLRFPFLLFVCLSVRKEERERERERDVQFGRSLAGVCVGHCFRPPLLGVRRVLLCQHSSSKTLHDSLRIMLASTGKRVFIYHSHRKEKIRAEEDETFFES